MQVETTSGKSSSRDVTDVCYMLRWMGLAGMVGAVLMFAGDMLYYYSPNVEQSFVETMGSVPPWRLLLGGALAPVACWFYALGSGQVYLALRLAGKGVALVAFGSFAAIMIFYGLYHAAFASLGFGAQVAHTPGVSREAMLRLPEDYLGLLLLIAYVPITIWTVLFVFAVLFRPSRYPRWIALFTPTFLYLLQGAIVSLLPGILYVIIGGGYNNLIMLLFFMVSTIALWNGGRLQEAKAE